MNEKHFGMRLPKSDYDVLVALAERDRSTVAQQVRQAVARYIALGNGVIESRDSEQNGQTGSAQAKPENSDMDFVCHDIAPSPNLNYTTSMSHNYTEKSDITTDKNEP